MAQTATLTVDEIIQKNTQAMGGAAKLKSTKSVKMTGVSTVGGMEAPTVMVMKRPDKVRVDLTVQDQTVTQATDAASSWMINPFMGGADAQPMPEEQAADFRNNGELEGPLVDYKAKGNTVELVAKESVDGKEAYKLKLTRKGGKPDTIYLDASTFLQVKQVSRRNIMGQDTDIETILSDYKEVGGIQYAHSIEQIASGNPVFAMKITKIEVDVPVEDSIFAMPKKAEKKE